MKSGGDIHCDYQPGARIAEDHLSFSSALAGTSCIVYQAYNGMSVVNVTTFSPDFSDTVVVPLDSFAVRAFATDGKDVYVQLQKYGVCYIRDHLTCKHPPRMFFGKVVIDRQNGVGHVDLLHPSANFSAREFVVEGGELFLKGVLTESGGRPAQVHLR